MSLLPPLRKGQRLDLGFFGRIIDTINFLLNLTVGPGLQVQRGGNGWSLWVDKEKIGGGGTENCTGGTLQEIVQTQATDDNDDWSRADDDCPVSLEVITDIEYNQTSHILAFRTRLLTFDRCGKLKEIAAEGEPTTITEAEAC